MLDVDSVANKFVQQVIKHQLRVFNYSYCSLLAIVAMCTSTIATASYILFAHIIAGYYPSTVSMI